MKSVTRFSLAIKLFLQIQYVQNHQILYDELDLFWLKSVFSVFFIFLNPLIVMKCIKVR